MPNYVRAYLPGGTFFFTVVTFHRRPLFIEESNRRLLKSALSAVMTERPFMIHAAVILFDHMHFLWQLPPGDSNYSWRIGRMKAHFTQRLATEGRALPTAVNSSRLRSREGSVWQRRFYEHVIRDQDDFNEHLDYIHYNPVKHGLASCPHAFGALSFDRWVSNRHYSADWLCCCKTNVDPPNAWRVSEGAE